jgi:hypothetical protein
MSDWPEVMSESIVPSFENLLSFPFVFPNERPGQLFRLVISHWVSVLQGKNKGSLRPDVFRKAYFVKPPLVKKKHGRERVPLSINPLRVKIFGIEDVENSILSNGSRSGDNACGRMSVIQKSEDSNSWSPSVIYTLRRIGSCE